MKQYQENYYQKVLELAKQAKFICRPNPAVGAVIVKNNEIIGEGYTQKIGKEHAEIKAINSVKSKELLQGSELYVSLSPCTFTGRTPPCSEAILTVGIKRVHIGLKDNCAKVKEAKGFFGLQGVEIIYDFPENIQEELFHLNYDYHKWQRFELPLISLKYAMTLDGKMATYLGDSKWITEEKTRKHVHYNRALHDAVLVGERTYELDNPWLNVRLSSIDIQDIFSFKLSRPITIKQPKPLVLLLKDNLKERDLLVKEEFATLFLVSSRFTKAIEKIKSYKKEVFFYDNFENTWKDKLFFQALLRQFSLTSFYVEGGSKIHYDLVNNNLVDVINVYIGSKLLVDGSHGLSPFSSRSNQFIEKMSEVCIPFKGVWNTKGKDLFFKGRLNEKMYNILSKEVISSKE